MPLGASIFLIAAGATLRYAVAFHIAGASRPTVGLIVILAGLLGVALSLLSIAAARRSAAGYHEARGI